MITIIIIKKKIVNDKIIITSRGGVGGQFPETYIDPGTSL